MTGYGRGEAENEAKKFTVEIKSINHRYLEVIVKQPKQYMLLEDKIRRLVQEYIKRGRVEIYIKVEETGLKKQEVKVDKENAIAYYNSLKDLADFLQISPNVNIYQLATLPDVIKVEEMEEDLEDIWVVMEKAHIKALEQLTAMREAEGQSLKNDLIQRIILLQDLSAKIERRSPVVVEEYRERLQNRLKELMTDTSFDETRFNQEIVYFAEKCNITEELVRLKSHFQQFLNSLESAESIGRKLDFLVQELNRETNTIGAKANDLEISQLVVEMKSEIEKIREQVQNIE
ncbi:MAG: YicC family protein [Clostridia bacterium]|nr:YicC family protein [Clostridia bacterium]